MKVSRDECWWTGSDNIRRSSRLHGFLVWGILCCKFFSFLHFCSPKTPRWKKKSIIKDWKNKHSVIFSRTWIQSARSVLFFSLLVFNGAASCNFYIWEGNSLSLVRSPENQRAGLLNELCMSLPCYELFRFTILAVYKALEKYLAKKQSTEFIKNNKIPFQVMFLLPDECEVSWHLIFFTVWEFVSHPPNFLSDDWPPISTQQVPVCLTWQSISWASVVLQLD